MKRIAFSFLAAAALAFGALAQDKPVNAGPYVPSPQSVVTDMLKLANVNSSDYVIDLGSGDGRIVLTAAKVFGARGFGVEIQDKLVRLSNEAAVKEGIADRVKFITQDLFKTDISQATVLTMYLLPNTVNMLSDKLLTELRPGTRVISHDYPLAGWIPEQYVAMDLEDKVAISGVTTTLIYLYVVPAKVAGSWNVKGQPNGKAVVTRLDLKQQVSKISGFALVEGKSVPLEDAKLKGDQISFRLAGRNGTYSGTIKDGAISGTFAAGSTKANWTASK